MGAILNDKIEKIYPLAPLQQGLYFLKMKEVSSTQYVIQNLLELQGDISSEIITDAFQLMSVKFEILRAVLFADSNGKPIHVILKDRYVECYHMDVSDFSEEEKSDTVKRKTADDLNRGFNFKSDSLMRITIIKMGRGKFTLLWTFHHIIMDGWSLGILKNYFYESVSRLLAGETFEALKNNIELERKHQPEYSDYIKWLESKSFAVGEEYWRNYLKDYQETVEIKGFEGDLTAAETQMNIGTDLSPALSKAIEAAADLLHVTYSEIFETCWGILLQQFSNTDDAVFGKVVSGRNAAVSGAEGIVGLFINTIPTRIDCRENPVIGQLLKAVHKKSMECSDYDYIPLSITQSYSIQGSNLIKSIYTFENYYQHETESCGKISIKINQSREETSYDLSLLVYKESLFHVRMMYNPKRYSKSAIDVILTKFLYILEFVAMNPAKRVAEIALADPLERQKILHTFNDLPSFQNSGHTISSCFKAIVKAYGKKTAVIYQTETITYERLDVKSDQIAGYLGACGVQTEDYIGLICSRGIDMIIAMLGIIKAGAAYVPIDASYPKERINYILEDCRPKLILTDDESAQNLDLDKSVTVAEILRNGAISANILPLPPDQNNLAYLIYTSGTTGKPKGVAVEHKGVVNLSSYFKAAFHVTDQDRVLQFANYVFDASVWEITMALLCGGTLVIAPPQCLKDMEAFENYCDEHHVSIATLPPQFFIQTGGLKTRLLITAGSEANREVMDKALKAGRYINAYGPTETTVCATCYEPRDQVRSEIPIGKPISGFGAYILRDLTMCGIGIPGELCIAGIGLARGYLNKPDLTAEKFIDNPFGEGKLYRTGDLARWLPDGNIEFLGRIDQQIKLRGFRIEPGEIDYEIRQINGIMDVAVTTVQSPGSEQVLVAFVVSDAEIEADQMKEQLRVHLPSYMIPDFIIQIDRIPVNRNGKLDKNLLPQISSVIKTEYMAPRDEWEINMCKCFREALKVSRVGIHDNIFELGANSLTVINILLRAAKTGSHITIQNLYDHPTVHLLGKFLKSDRQTDYFIDNPSDYARLNTLLKNNIVREHYEYHENQFQHVLITGAAGFLGVHIAAALLLQEDCNLYCVVRGSDREESIDKFNHAISYYFQDTLQEQIKNRVTVLCADITNRDNISALPQQVEGVIHVAADIRHFGKKEDFHKTNVLGTKYMVEYAQSVGAKLAYISTSSVCGNVYEDHENRFFSEENYYIGQFFTSPYARSKFEAEKIVLESGQNGFDTFIIRVGNLTNRIMDGVTIKDVDSNRFYALIKAYMDLGYISDRIEHSELEFSPVDLTAKGVVILLKAHKPEETVYHLFNNKKIKMKLLLEVLADCGYTFQKVGEEELLEKIRNTLNENDKKRIYEAITRTDVFDLEKPVKEIDFATKFTEWILANHQFSWDGVGRGYLQKVITYWLAKGR